MIGKNASSTLQAISGWILPNGTWREVPEWWHLTVLYDLRDEGLDILQGEQVQRWLNAGDEGEIRHEAAKLGLVKVSRSSIDAYTMNDAQLVTLQGLFDCCSLEDEVTIIIEGGASRRWSITRILKLKKPAAIFRD